LEIWSKHWPVLKKDAQVLQLEKDIRQKVEYRKHILGTENPKNTQFDEKTSNFSQESQHQTEIDLWTNFKKLSASDSPFSNLIPQVVDI